MTASSRGCLRGAAGIVWLCALLSVAGIFTDAFSQNASSSIPQGSAAGESLYIGPGSCSSSSCHGSVAPKTETRVQQDEYSIWVVKDKHSRAFAALSSSVSQRMARILNLGKADAARKCLACHALDVPPARRGRSFELNDGVSCESCHGPASVWLGPHATRDFPHEKSVQLGMYDTRDLVRRAEKCLSCHLGTPEKSVDHEMIAAGHPDLYFELDSFSAVMPAHWKQPGEKDPWNSPRAWAVGQAVQLREALRQLSRRATAGPWPEFAEMQCYACHHALTRPEESWRQERGYPGRRPGSPPWNSSRYAVFRALAGLVDADAAKQLDADLGQLSEWTTRLDGDRSAITLTANRAADAAERLAQQLNSRAFDAEFVLRLLQWISADADDISGRGERAAEQAVLALDGLFIAYSRNVRVANAAEIRASIGDLFHQVENPAAYNPAAFAAQMRKVNSLLR